MEVKEDPQFDKYFSLLASKIASLDKAIDYSKLSDAMERWEIQRDYFAQFYPEIEKVIPMWTWLNTQLNGRICFHTLRMLYCTLNDKNYLLLSPEKQNVIKWTIILHDIAKRNVPTFKEDKKDPAHPYNSAIVALDVFNSLSEYKETFSQAKIKLLQEKIKASIIDDYIPDLKELGNILEQAKDIFVSSHFCYLVFKLIIMHQALPYFNTADQPVYLTDEEIKKYCDVEFLQLMKIIATNDLINYHLQNSIIRQSLCDAIEELYIKYFKLISPS